MARFKCGREDWLRKVKGMTGQLGFQGRGCEHEMAEESTPGVGNVSVKLDCVRPKGNEIGETRVQI